MQLKSLGLLHAVRNLFPDDVSICCKEITDSHETLFPEELNFVLKAVPKRKREFIAGRNCAHEAIKELGLARTPILVGADREPIWPIKIAGSITHDGGYCIAVIAKKCHIAHLGVDMTMREALDDDVARLICTPREIKRIKALRSTDHELDPYKLTFSVKESIYKCLFPLVKEVFDFQEVEICLQPSLFEPQAANGKASVSVEFLSDRLHFARNLDLNIRLCVYGPYIVTSAWIAGTV